MERFNKKLVTAMNVVSSLLSALRLRLYALVSPSLQSQSAQSIHSDVIDSPHFGIDAFAGALGLAVLANIPSFSPGH
jgi:hypothetical protein